MKFNKWDMVKVIPKKIKDSTGLLVDTKYVVEDQDKDFVYLFEDSDGSKHSGYYPYRFEKVPVENLTEKEKFRIIKYKLGAKTNA